MSAVCGKSSNNNRANQYNHIDSSNKKPSQMGWFFVFRGEDFFLLLLMNQSGLFGFRRLGNFTICAGINIYDLLFLFSIHLVGIAVLTQYIFKRIPTCVHRICQIQFPCFTFCTLHSGRLHLRLCLIFSLGTGEGRNTHRCQHTDSQNNCR